MRHLEERLGAWRLKYEKMAVLSLIFGFVLLVGAACLWKYSIFGYNGIDLGYFSQVFWNTVHGRPFAQSIHPHLSLGDHAELAILPLSLFFALWQDPRMLLLLQALALGACAWPVWRIAKFRLAGAAEEARYKSVALLLPLVFAAAFILNPSLHNIGLFEFHVLPFALFPLLMAMLAYDIGKKRDFVLWLVLALLVREDVALVVVMFGALAWMERKATWWRVVPAALGAAWFVGAMALISHFAPEGAYKFRIYYAWLGATPLEMLAFPFTHPLIFLGHFFTLANLEMLLGFLMPFAFLPLLRPRRLVLLLPPLAQILLAAPGGGELVLQTHYATLFMPALVLAAIDGLAAAPRFAYTRFSMLRFAEPHALVAAVLLLCAVHGTVMLGPLPSAAWRAAFDSESRMRADRYHALLAEIPGDASVAASYRLLPALSTRTGLTALHYVALGVTQFAEAPYPAPDFRFVALDADDLLAYRAQFSRTAWAAPYVDGINERVRGVLGLPVFLDGTAALYDRDALLMDPPHPQPPALPAGQEMAVFAQVSALDDATMGVRVDTALGWWKAPEDAFARYVLSDADGKVLLEDRVPVDAPLPWTSRNGGTGLLFTATLPETKKLPLKAEVFIETATLTLRLDAVRSTAPHLTDEVTLLRGAADAVLR